MHQGQLLSTIGHGPAYLTDLHPRLHVSEIDQIIKLHCGLAGLPSFWSNTMIHESEDRYTFLSHPDVFPSFKCSSCFLRLLPSFSGLVDKPLRFLILCLRTCDTICYESQLSLVPIDSPASRLKLLRKTRYLHLSSFWALYSHQSWGLLEVQSLCKSEIHTSVCFATTSKPCIYS
jgi:hypothetical protein